jgi:hypothetical protein
MINYTIDEVEKIFENVLVELRAYYNDNVIVDVEHTESGLKINLEAMLKTNETLLATMYAVRPCVVRTSPDKRSKTIGYLNTEDIVKVYATKDVFMKIPISSRWGWVDTYNLESFSSDLDTTSPALNLDVDMIYHLENPLTGEEYTTQYISLKDIGYKTKHYNLCGEFCVAALDGIYVQDLISSWKSVYTYADHRLKNDESTSIYDLGFMLNSVEITHKTETFSPSTKPLTASDFVGKKAIVGVGINNAGKILEDGKIRHWVVILGCVPYMTTGFVRIYNPFTNKEELVDFRVLYKSMCPGGLGTTLIWIP